MRFVVDFLDAWECHFIIVGLNRLNEVGCDGQMAKLSILSLLSDFNSKQHFQFEIMSIDIL